MVMPALTPFPDAFVTPRLYAERLTEQHYADVYAMHQDPLQMALLGGVRDAAMTRNYLDHNLLHWDRYGFGVWMVRDAGGEMCGRTLLRHLDVDAVDEVETGYSFNPACWGRGYATEIAVACIDIGIEHLHLPSVVAITLPHNAASRRVMVKAGMAYERDVIHGDTSHVLYRSGGEHHDRT